MRTHAAFWLVAFLPCALASAQVADAPAVAEVKPQPGNEIVKIFYLKHAAAQKAVEALKQVGPPCQAVEDKRLNAVVVRGTAETLDEVTKFLEAIDDQGTGNEVTQILYGQTEDVEASGALVTQIAKMSGVEIAFDEDLGIFMIKGPKDEVHRVSEVIDAIKLQTGKERSEKGELRPYALRVLWLSNDPVEDSRHPIEPDAALKKSIQKLAELGMPNMKVKMQALGRCDMTKGQGTSQIEGTLLSGNVRRALVTKAKIVAVANDLVSGKISLEARSTEGLESNGEPTRTTVEVDVLLEPKKYYILSASPVGSFQTAFVVQLIEDL